MQVRNIFKVRTSPQGILFIPVKGLNRETTPFQIKSGSFIEATDEGIGVAAIFEKEEKTDKQLEAEDPLSLLTKIRQVGSFF